jgi:hypothetical protein
MFIRRRREDAAGNYADMTKVLQLYISIYQHPSIIESCWRHVVPVFNHTIRMNIEEFKNQNKYQVSQVIRNLVQNILD